MRAVASAMGIAASGSVYAEGDLEWLGTWGPRHPALIVELTGPRWPATRRRPREQPDLPLKLATTR